MAYAHKHNLRIGLPDWPNRMAYFQTTEGTSVRKPLTEIEGELEKDKQQQ